MIKVDAPPASRAEIMQIVDIFRAKIIDISMTKFTIEVTGNTDKVDAIEKLLSPFGIKEVVRTGKIAMGRGSRTAMTQLKELLENERKAEAAAAAAE
jgi:acetolactate synthase-1/3 small subunit